jgi:ADP-ribose pyrophosphatase YjhB (NUDIX family)
VKVSAGLALVKGGTKLLLAHPTRARWRGSYSIPKGLVEPGEALAAAAIRETLEEVGIQVFPPYLEPGGVVDYVRGRTVTKRVHWYRVDVTALEPPDVLPRHWLQLAEVDWAGFLTLDEARERVLPRQLAIVEACLG